MPKKIDKKELKKKTRKLRLSKADMDKIPELVMQGLTFQQIGELLGFSHNAVHKAYVRIRNGNEKQKQLAVERKIKEKDDIAGTIEIIKNELIEQIAMQVKNTKNIKDLSGTLLNILQIEKILSASEKSGKVNYLIDIVKSLGYETKGIGSGG